MLRMLNECYAKELFSTITMQEREERMKKKSRSMKRMEEGYGLEL